MNIFIFHSTVINNSPSEGYLEEAFREKCKELSKKAREIINELSEDYCFLPRGKISERDLIERKEVFNKMQNLLMEIKEFTEEIEKNYKKYEKEDFFLMEEFSNLAVDFEPLRSLRGSENTSIYFDNAWLIKDRIRLTIEYLTDFFKNSKGS